MNGPTLEELYALFPAPGTPPAYRFIPGEEVPEPYRELLAAEYPHLVVG